MDATCQWSSGQLGLGLCLNVCICDRLTAFFLLRVTLLYTHFFESIEPPPLPALQDALVAIVHHPPTRQHRFSSPHHRSILPSKTDRQHSTASPYFSAIPQAAQVDSYTSTAPSLDIAARSLHTPQFIVIVLHRYRLPTCFPFDLFSLWRFLS